MWHLYTIVNHKKWKQQFVLNFSINKHSFQQSSWDFGDILNNLKKSSGWLRSLTIDNVQIAINRLYANSMWFSSYFAFPLTGEKEKLFLQRQNRSNLVANMTTRRGFFVFLCVCDELQLWRRNRDILQQFISVKHLWKRDTILFSILISKKLFSWDILGIKKLSVGELNITRKKTELERLEMFLGNFSRRSAI